MHCYGIGDNIVRFNAYSNNATFNIDETRQATSIRKNYVDFNHPDRFGGVVYQNSSSANSETTDNTYFSGSNENKAFAQTAEIEVVFPRKFEFANSQYFDTPFITASIFGRHQVNGSNPNSWRAQYGLGEFYNVYAVRPYKNSKDAYFVLDIPSYINSPLTSSIYSNIYDNQKWNFAVRINSKEWPYATGSAIASPPSIDGGGGLIDIDFVGYNVENGVVRNEFLLTTSSQAANPDADGLSETANHRFFVGAQRVNFTGSVNLQTDILATSFRVFETRLENDVIKSHALDPENYGTRNPHRNFMFYNDASGLGGAIHGYSSLDPAIRQSIPESVALALNWDYSQVTTTDATGEFTVEDASSGSASLANGNRYPNENVLKNVNRQFAGRGYFPSSTNSTNVISKQFVQSSRQRLPEVINTDDNVNVLTRDDELYPRDAAAYQMYYAFEKSMYGVVSQEMVNLFSSVVAFNDLIGEVVNKYRGEYKSMRLLRELFFEKMQNNPDLDKFIDYYKWIDASLSLFLQQLVPASADVSDEIRTMVEDHILTRSKYQHQYPHLDYKGNARFGGDEAKLEARAFGINELDYNWQFGHAPTTNSQTEHSIWWKQRAERDNTAFNTAALIDSARQDLNDIILSFNSASVDNLNTAAAVSYAGSTYAVRRFATPVKLQTAIVDDIGGGYNYPRGHKPDGIFPLIKKGAGTFWRAENKAVPDIAKEELRPVIKQEKRRVTGINASENNAAIGEGGTATLGAIVGTKYLAPFVPFSSSVSPANGYGQSMQTGDDITLVLNAEEAAGYHNDSYGDDYEVPMQGPFTNQHVGGNRHRHTDLNEGSDLTNNRAEAWSLALDGALSTFDEGDSSSSRLSTRPNYRRDQTAKRPVNIKNIKHRTGSLGTVAMGNFDKKYEIVSTTSRTANNAAFVKAEGTGSFTITVAGADEVGYIDHVTDYAKPTRRRTPHVIVSRFSAPGGPETAGDNQGGPGLDFEAAEFSPYNNLNYRNTTVRDPLKTLLSEHSAQFGLKSGSAVSALDYTTNITASFHKTNRNTLRRVVSGAYGGSSVTASIFDNYYVQHMIPQSDLQYSWITASLESLTNPVIGYLPYDGLVSSSSGLISAINFVSASELGSGISTSNSTRQPKAENGSYKEGSFVATDFAGINSNIIEPISSSTFTIGFPLSTEIIHYYNFADIADQTFPGFNTAVGGGFITRINQNAANINRAGALHHLLTHRGDAGTHSTWRQIRVGQSQLARHYRNNNIYSHTPSVAESITINIDGGTTTVPVRFRDTISLERTPLDETQKPLLYKLVVDVGETNAGRKLLNETILKSSFGNKLLYFDDPIFNEALGLRSDFGDPAYRTLLNIYGRKRGDDSTAPIQRLSLLEYTETVYPSKKNAYKSEIRGRTGYENNFWRDAREDRDTKGTLKKTKNSANNTTVLQSAWSLDAQIDFSTFSHTPSSFPAGAAGRLINNGDSNRPGELQNEYVHVHAGTSSLARPGVLYARKQIYPATGSIVAKWGMEIKEVTSSVGPDYLDKALIPTASLFRGEASWQAATDAGFYEGTSSVFVSSSTEGNPFYDTYGAYFADIKSKGKSFSTIPEFRITDHLGFYGQNDEDFLVENQKLFSIVGASTSSTIPQNSSEDNFYSIFSTSDFLKYFEIIKKDHDGVVDPHSIKLKCKAIKKFNPYDGFYPAERTIQMANEFVNDFSASLNRITGVDAGVAGSLRTFMKPLFAPGILYNTIKAGLAVDYPILRANATQDITDGIVERPKRGATYDPISISNLVVSSSYFTSSFAIMSSTHTASVLATDYVHDHFDGWDKRIPFEAIVDPENYLANVRIGDDEPSAYARVLSTVSWDGSGGTRYKKMMNNFLAESISFFLKGGEVSKIESLPQSQFKSVVPGQPYGMRVKMWRSQDKGSLASGSWGDFEVPQNLPVIVANGEVDPFSGETNSTGADTDSTPKETFTMYSRPAAFGPPLGLYRTGSFDQWEATGRDRWPGTINDFTPSNGIYGSHTPPYYDGEAWFDIIFWPKGLETQYVTEPPHLFRFQSGETGEAYKPTLDEIFAKPNEALFRVSGSAANTEASAFSNTQIPLAGSFTRKWRYDQESLRNVANSSYHTTTATGVSSNAHIVRIGPASGPFMNEWAMHLDSCLNIFNKDPNPSLPDNQRRWSIQTKFETPMLNFNHVTSSDGTLIETTDTKANAAIPRGMWHQFGRLPQGEEGVYIQVTDIPTQWLETHPSASLRADIAGQSSSRNKSPYVFDSAQAKTYYNKYSVPIGNSGSNTQAQTFQSPDVQSLVDVCGFPTEPVRLGEVRNKRTLSEAIVAVPFRVVDGERKFYETFKTTDPETVVSGRSYRKLVQTQRKYVFPPTFDFVNNTSVTPVAMYVFEFNHDFDTNDLSMIWQNVAPKIVSEAQSAYSTIEHELLANELLTNIEETAKAQFFGTQMPYIDLDKEIQWMVFKVKQRASRDYFTKIKRQLPEMPFYTDNWPYDYCSLVELAQLDAAIQFRKISPDRKVGYKELTPEEAAAFAGRGEAGSGGTSGQILAESGLIPPGNQADAGIGDLQVYDDTTGDDTGSGPTILTPGGEVDAETFVGQTAGDVMGSLEGGPGAVGDAAGGYSDGTAGTDAAGSTPAGGAGFRNTLTDGTPDGLPD